MKLFIVKLSLLFVPIVYSIELNAQTSKEYENASDKLVLYTGIPGLEQLYEFYTIRVRSKATNNIWQDCFEVVTRSKCAEALIETGSTENYFEHLTDWSHTYVNLEMSGKIEIEISKKDGSDISTAVVHPAQYASAVTIDNGKAYFSMDKPALVAIDINGQMDKQNTGRFASGGSSMDLYDGPAIHTLSIFANPIFEKPNISGEGVVVIQPQQSPPTNPNDYNTLFFAPGVHTIGLDFPVHSDKKYFIPGDAIIYGTFGNHDDDNGQNIKIFGVGTISGDPIKHPSYDLNSQFYGNSANPVDGRPWKPISILGAYKVTIEGVCIANPAFHSISLVSKNGTKGIKSNSAKWTKVISWRVNGDGIGNVHLMEDCFLRCQDDATYVKGDKRRCVFWNDANGASFVLNGMDKGYPIVIEDCDVIYARAQWHKWQGGRVFSGRTINDRQGQVSSKVLFRDIRISDPRPTLQIFNIYSISDFDLIGNPSGLIDNSYEGVTFQHISAAEKNVCNLPEVFRGCVESPYSGWSFDDVSIAGKTLTSISDFAYVQNVSEISFNANITDDATLFDIYVDNFSLPNFDPSIENYEIDLQEGSEIPTVSATQTDYNSIMSVQQAKSTSGSARIKVVAEDGITTKTYVVKFNGGAIPGKIQAEAYVSKNDIISDKGTYLTNFAVGRDVVYQTNVAKSGNYRLSLNVATTRLPPFSITIRTDNPETSQTFSFDAKTTDWNIYKEVVIENVSLPAGEQTLTVTSNDNAFNFDWFRFEDRNVLSTMENKKEGLKTYPNPIKNGFLSIASNTTLDKLEILDLNGKIVYRAYDLGVYKRIDVSSLDRGIYLLYITENKSKSVRKLVVF